VVVEDDDEEEVSEFVGTAQAVGGGRR